jgi:hypothetical protein
MHLTFEIVCIRAQLSGRNNATVEEGRPSTLLRASRHSLHSEWDCEPPAPFAECGLRRTGFEPRFSREGKRKPLRPAVRTGRFSGVTKANKMRNCLDKASSGNLFSVQSLDLACRGHRSRESRIVLKMCPSYHVQPSTDWCPMVQADERRDRRGGSRIQRLGNAT